MTSITFTDKTYNAETFFKDVEGYDTIIYKGNDAGIFKEIVINARTANKAMEYYGSLDTSYMARKMKNFVVKSTEDEPIIEEYVPPVIEIIEEETDIINEDLTTDEAVDLYEENKSSTTSDEYLGF